MSSERTESADVVRSPGLTAGRFGLAFAILIGAMLAIVSWDGLRVMVSWWDEPEYNHGYAIPLIALYLLWCRVPESRRADMKESWTGVAMVGAGLAGVLVGELSAIYAIIQYSFVFILWGFTVTAVGLRGVRIFWAGLAYLIFMVPLPRFFQFTLTSELQLISSELGAWMLRLLGVSVYLSGNILDLGVYQLQVVEACAGLRYLFPLMSLGFLFAVLYRGPGWQRALVFLSTIPISIVMNALRISIIGVLIDRYSVDLGEGFLHFFEGWVIFMICIGILLLEMAVLARFAKPAPGEALFDVRVPPMRDLAALFTTRKIGAPLATAALLLAVVMLVSGQMARRAEMVPVSPVLAAFPLEIGNWSGRAGSLPEDELRQLQLSDYMLNIYRNDRERAELELYVAYYDSQRKGASVHSPRACIPGSGWRIDNLTQRRIPDVGADGSALTVNRTLISMGSSRRLVYYWFDQRGRDLTNEYLVKWFIFWDALTKNRTDGALVRVMTPVSDMANIDAADQRLEDFVRLAMPRLSYHLPQESAAMVQARSAARAPARRSGTITAGLARIWPIGHNTGPVACGPQVTVVSVRPVRDPAMCGITLS